MSEFTWGPAEDARLAAIRDDLAQRQHRHRLPAC